MNNHSAQPLMTILQQQPENAFRSLVKTVGLLERLMQPHFARFGISGSQWGVLRTLNRVEETGQPGLRLTDLSEQLVIRPPSVTGMVDRLVRMKLVNRTKVASDTRARLVSLTPKGRELVTRVLKVHAGQIDGILNGLSADEQATLHCVLGRFDDHLQQLIDTGWMAAAE